MSSEVLRGNEKRKATSKKVGGVNKKKGHDNEAMFNIKFDKPRDVSYKAEADCIITARKYIDLLDKTFGKSASKESSLKSGKTQQFTLGRIDELSTISDDEKLKVIYERSLWEKYLGKSNSARPPFFYVYRDDTAKSWIFFRMSDVLDFIVTKSAWRVLPSGRMKGDFKDKSKKGARQYLTFEHRPNKGYFLGLCGGNSGINFIGLIKDALLSLEISDQD